MWCQKKWALVAGLEGLEGSLSIWKVLSEHTPQCIITIYWAWNISIVLLYIKTWGAEVHGFVKSWTLSDWTKSYLKAPAIQKMQTSETRSVCFLVLLSSRWIFCVLLWIQSWSNTFYLLSGQLTILHHLAITFTCIKNYSVLSSIRLWFKSIYVFLKSYLTRV